MGFLTDGEALGWSELTPEIIQKVKAAGIAQFCRIWAQYAARRRPEILWGDEIEYMIVRLAPDGTVQLSLTAPDVIRRLRDDQNRPNAPPELCDIAILPEYGSYMIEATPRRPYGASLSALLDMETNARRRRTALQSYLAPDEYLITFAHFPMLGVGAFTHPPAQPNGPIAESAFLPDELINPHPRYRALTRNIRERRGTRVRINVPVFTDIRTPSDIVLPPQVRLTDLTPDLQMRFRALQAATSCWRDSPPTPQRPGATTRLRSASYSAFRNNSFQALDELECDDIGCATEAAMRGPISPSVSQCTSPRVATEPRPLFPPPACAQPVSRLTPLQCLEVEGPVALPANIFADAMGFGMGACGLQLTMQCPSRETSMYLYDQLLPLCPLFLAVSANAPIFRGMVSDWDARYSVISDSVDDRTPAERGLACASPCGAVPESLVPQSRYGTADSFLSDHPACLPRFNNVTVRALSEEARQLTDDGLPHRVALHVGHLFVRDPLVVYGDKIDLPDSVDDHWECLQSTNWQTARWKPPPTGTDIGWRVEFRPMDVQLLDFSNAALCAFVNLLLRAVRLFDLRFYVPQSAIHEGMHRAHKRGAVTAERFFFRTDIFNPLLPAADGASACGVCDKCGTTLPPSQNAELDSVTCCAFATDLHNLRVAIRARFAAPTDGSGSYEADVRELSLDQIFNGAEGFPGLANIVRAYLDVAVGEPFSPSCPVHAIDADQRARIDSYVDFVSGRAAGTVLTEAEWQRRFVVSHPAYMRDSVVTQEIARDLVIAVSRLTPAALGHTSC
jgi:glutamate--cysteine ligase catalytic subunit